MSVTAVEPMPDAEERAHLRLCGIVTLETMACFAVPAVALVVGTVYSPILFLAAVADSTASWAWRPLAMFVFGCAGLVGVGRLLRLVWNRPQPDSRRWLTLSGIACGSAASILQWVTVWMGDAPGGPEVLLPIVYLPLACTAHLLYLARRPLFTRPDTLS